MNKRLLAGAAIALVLGLPVVLARVNGGDEKQVSIEEVRPRSVRASVLGSGSFAFTEQAVLSPETIGSVRAILVAEGDPVVAGQVVLLLDREAFEAEVEQQQSAVRQQRIDIDRQRLNADVQARRWRRSRELFEQRLLDEASHEQAKLALQMAELELRTSLESLRQAEAVLAQISERLGKTEIRAPIGGTVTSIQIKVGETAVPSSTGIAGSSLMTIANVSSMVTEVKVDEVDIARVRIGQPVEIHAAAFPDTALGGTVESIPLSPMSSGATGFGEANVAGARNYAVRVRLEDPEAQALRPGMTCRAEIFTRTASSALAVPVQAVLDGAGSTEPGDMEGERHHVFTVDGDGRARKTEVRPGVADDSHVEIREGLRAGERVIVGPYKVLRHLREGDSVAQRSSGAGA